MDDFFIFSYLIFACIVSALIAHYAVQRKWVLVAWMTPIAISFTVLYIIDSAHFYSSS